MTSRKKDGASSEGATTTKEPTNVEVLGTVKRVVRRALTPTDRADIDAQLHALIESKASNERQQKRAAKALGKLRKRGSALDEQVRELHGKWSSATSEDVVACRVERTPTEIRIVHPDGTVIYARPLTKDELSILSSRLPTVGESATIHHPELDQHDEVAQVEQRQAEAKAQHAELAQSLTFEQAIAEVDAKDESPEEPAEEKPKKGKGKKKGKQLELGAGGNNAKH